MRDKTNKYIYQYLPFDSRNLSIVSRETVKSMMFYT